MPWLANPNNKLKIFKFVWNADTIRIKPLKVRALSTYFLYWFEIDLLIAGEVRGFKRFHKYLLSLLRYRKFRLIYKSGRNDRILNQSLLTLILGSFHQKGIALIDKLLIRSIENGFHHQNIKILDFDTIIQKENIGIVEGLLEARNMWL